MIHTLIHSKRYVWFTLLMLLFLEQPALTFGKPPLERVQIKHARGFRIKYYPTHKEVELVSPLEKGKDVVRYALVSRGAPHPKGFSPNQIIEIPLRSLVVMSSMHIGLVEFLQSESILVGLGNIQYVYSPKVIQLINQKKIVEIGKDQTINDELIITMKPDLVMAVGQPNSQLDRYKTLNAAGIPVLANSEWVETTPLGRAEWVKLMAILVNKEHLVNEKFAAIEKEYNRLKTLTQHTKTKPSIITGTSYKDSWYVPNGNSFMAQFFRDAGISYHWNATRASSSLPLNFEAVYPIGLKADYWLNVGISGSDTKKDILAKDKRYADFKAFKTGRLYSYSNRINSRESNDFWESGTVNPHLVLADLIRIVHPDLLPHHQLYYYKQLK
ncbi:MAG: ABC transporter substrate-binding protein [Siphonobacter sp.]